MWKVIESILGNIAAYAYRRNWRIADRLSRLSWKTYDRCPEGYKGK